MKKIIIIIILVFAGINVLQAEWNKLFTERAYFSREFIFFNELEGLMIAPDGYMAETKDGGKSWNYIYTGTKQELWNMQFVNETIGYVCGEKGTILKTDDRGKTWQDISLEEGKDYLCNLFFVDEENGWIATRHGQVFRTTDGGANWDKFKLPVEDWVSAIHFFDEKIGIITVGTFVYTDEKSWQIGYIMKTNDGGETWEIMETVNSYLQDICVAPNGTILIGGNWGTLLKSTDGGKSWIELELNTAFGISDIEFVNDKVAYGACGSRNDGGGFIVSIDGGKTWQDSGYLFDNRIDQIFILDQETIWASGKNPCSIYKFEKD